MASYSTNSILRAACAGFSLDPTPILEFVPADDSSTEDLEIFTDYLERTAHRNELDQGGDETLDLIAALRDSDCITDFCDADHVIESYECSASGVDLDQIEDYLFAKKELLRREEDEDEAPTYYINRESLGGNANDSDARLVADHLAGLGYNVEFTKMLGAINHGVECPFSDDEFYAALEPACTPSRIARRARG